MGNFKWQISTLEAQGIRGKNTHFHGQQEEEISPHFSEEQGSDQHAGAQRRAADPTL